VGQTITGVDYISYDYGPWTPDFYLALEGVEEIREKIGLTSFGDIRYDYAGAVPEYRVQHLSKDELRILEQVNSEWGNASLRRILDYVYSTPPFVNTGFGERIDFSKIKA
jgi:hypothetical protein